MKLVVAIVCTASACGRISFTPIGGTLCTSWMIVDWGRDSVSVR